MQHAALASTGMWKATQSQWYFSGDIHTLNIGLSAVLTAFISHFSGDIYYLFLECQESAEKIIYNKDNFLYMSENQLLLKSW